MQSVGRGENVVFDIEEESLDIAGTGIEVDASGSVFTITRAGLYHVEWSINLASGVQPVLVCLLENGEPASALSNTVVRGNHSSGALINVTAGDIPFTVSLHNFGGAIAISDPEGYGGTAASIRITRFADGPAS